MIANLTLEFNETSLLDPSRLQDINATVVALETKAELNEVRVNQLTGEVGRRWETREGWEGGESISTNIINSIIISDPEITRFF